MKLFSVLFLVAAALYAQSPAPSRSPMPAITPSPTPGPIPLISPTPTATPKPSPFVTPTLPPSPSPAITPKPSPSVAPTPVPLVAGATIVFSNKLQVNAIFTVQSSTDQVTWKNIVSVPITTTPPVQYYRAIVTFTPTPAPSSTPAPTL